MNNPVVIKRIFVNVIITLSILNTSCGTNKNLLDKDNFSSIPQLKIGDAVAFERKIKSTNITPRHFVDIGESIYPNNKKYRLKAKSFKRKENPEFSLEADYYYTAKKRLIKVILYEWNKPSNEKLDVYDDNKIKSARFISFQNKFNELSDSLTKFLGQPIHTNIEQHTEAEQTFRDDMRWQGKNGVNAYLFMFGNNSNGYRQIRLALYKD